MSTNGSFNNADARRRLDLDRIHPAGAVSLFALPVLRRCVPGQTWQVDQCRRVSSFPAIQIGNEPAAWTTHRCVLRAAPDQKQLLRNPQALREHVCDATIGQTAKARDRTAPATSNLATSHAAAIDALSRREVEQRRRRSRQSRE
ncbi:MAG TPA: hypothetical protein VNQ56_04360 [Pseudolabrys sp.]|nr:hypothetical protein [Pseudolabrys sp.]